MSHDERPGSILPARVPRRLADVKAIELAL
jgi:hypothetical protein